MHTASCSGSEKTFGKDTDLQNNRVSAFLVLARCPRLRTVIKINHSDVDDIKFVINYDYPNNSEDYVHRIGRTGRRDKKVVFDLLTRGN